MRKFQWLVLVFGLVAFSACAGACGARIDHDGRGWRLQKTAGIGVGLEQGLHAAEQIVVALAEAGQALIPLIGRDAPDQLHENLFG